MKRDQEKCKKKKKKQSGFKNTNKMEDEQTRGENEIDERNKE